MSLARTLLSATTESVAIDTTGFNYDNVSTESYFVDAACEALVSDIFNVDKAYHVADIMGEVQVIKEGADGQAILEGMISSGIEKLKEVFRKFWAKLQAWFAQVKKFFKSLFLKGKDFVKEFKKEITDKKVTGFKYHAFKYTLSAGDAAGDKIMNEVNKRIDNLAGGIKKSDSVRDAEAIKAAIATIAGSNVGDGYTSTDYQEQVIKAIGLSGATNTSELTEELKKAYRDGEETAQDFEEFESNGKDEMLDLVESADKTIKQIEKDEKAFEKDVNSIIKALDSVKKSDNENAYKLAQRYSGYASAMLTLGKIPSTEKVNAYKEAANSFRSILGSFVRFKPAKEGAEFDEEDESDAPVGESLFEAAMRLI